MAHFAEINETGIVQRVVVVHNNELMGEDGIESEDNGILFCKQTFGPLTNWVQCSYNADQNGFRGIYPGIGSRYDKENDIFYDVVLTDPAQA